MDNREVLLEVKNVSKIYGDLHALKDVSFTIRKGEWVAIMGSSGSGKSTIMNIIGCMDKPTMGEVILDGQDITKESQTSLTKIRREKIGLIFQQFHLIPYLTALENVMVAQYYHSIPDEQEALQALERVGLKDRAKHLPSQLSGGEQQRVCIARALINSPEIILADEPTGNLDSKASHIIMEELADLHRQGNTIIMVTHNEKLTPYASRVITMLDGRISEDIASHDYFSVDKELDNDPRVRTEKKEDVLLLPKTHISKEVEEELKAEEELESKIKEQGLSEESEPFSDTNVLSENEAELLEDPNLAKFLDKKKNKKRAKTKKKSKKRKK